MKPRLLVVNQYYWPGVEATAHLLTELCEELAEEFDVVVVTGRLLGREHDPERERRNGVEIIRVRSTAYDRAPLHRRAANYVTYLAGAAVTALRLPRPDLVLCMTDPPMIGDVALLVARRFGVPLVVISQDVFPEIATELKRLKNPIVIGLLSRLVRFYLKRADRVVAIGETMRRRLEEKGAPPERVEVIPNWVDAQTLTPAPRRNSWSAEHGLDDKFVVMHSGNVGHAQDLDSLVRAATFLRDRPDVEILIVGHGARHAVLVELARRHDANTVRFLGYQPRELLALSLSSADVHVVGLAGGLAGFVVPSRLYGILAVGRPVIVAADAESETARLVERERCGVVVPPGRPELLVRVIRAAADGELDLEAMGTRGRTFVEREGGRTRAVQEYRRVFDELAGPTRRR